MKKMLLAGTALLPFVSGSAMAADMRPAPAPVYTKAPMMAPAFSWTGCYIGGHGGGVWSNDHYVLNNGAGLIEAFDFNPTSWIAGGQLGCEYQFSGGIVLGIEGTWSGLNLNQTDNSAISPARTRALKIDEITTVTGRLGYGWDRMQIYAKGGFADARVNIHTTNPTVAPNIVGDDTSWQSGWTVGGGLEYMPWQNIVLGAEFNYYRVTLDRSFAANPGAFTETTSSSNANIYSAMARLSYLFNFGH
jgi:outer membrane immunogenic protein